MTSADKQSDAPLRSVHTTTFPELLNHLGASLLVTTYQAGKLVVLRNDAGVLNTHFRTFNKPMGFAVSKGRLAVGCNVDVWEFHNVPAVCPKLDQRAVAGLPTEPLATTAGLPSPGGAGDPRTTASGDPRTPPAHSPGLLPEGEGVFLKHDGCFLPRRSHCTGDVQIHELAWVSRSRVSPTLEERVSEKLAYDEELVFVNTAFSCLATRSDRNSFEPKWRPPFITALAPGDRCHLNGLAVRDGDVRYVTALGATDSSGGWRENKRDGGALIDVQSNEIIADHLSMPHSPRWHRDQLWLL